MFVLTIFKSSLKLGHLISETRSPGQAKENRVDGVDKKV